MRAKSVTGRAKHDCKEKCRQKNVKEALKKQNKNEMHVEKMEEINESSMV